MTNMKIKLLSLFCAIAGFLSLKASESIAGVSWSVSVFDGPLGQSGHWIDRPGYGRCWYPAYVSSNWRPYCEGYWMWTDSGWYWVSTEPWGWATYHYGRWDYDSYYGWVWVPDTQWGPSWVEWREGDEYVGWAPLPPGAYYGPDGYVFAREHPIHDNFFVFVEVGHFSEPIHRRAVIVNNRTIINKTVNITRITRVNNVVVNNGPRTENIQRAGSRKLTEPMPHAALQQPRPTANTFKPVTAGEPRSPTKAEKTEKHEPEIIRGSPGAPPDKTESKQLEKPATEPTPTEKPERPQKDETNPYGKQQPGQNFGVKPTNPYAPVEPDSIQPKQRSQQPSREERAAEKQSRKEEGKDERSKKSDQGGN